MSPIAPGVADAAPKLTAGAMLKARARRIRMRDSVCLVFSMLDEAKPFGEQPRLGPRAQNTTVVRWRLLRRRQHSALLLGWSRWGELVLASIIGINLAAATLRFLFWGFRWRRASAR